MLLPGMLYKATPDDTMTFLRAAAESTGPPIMLYNNPIRSPNDVTPEMFAKLAE